MKIKSFLAKPYASVVHKRIQKSMQTAVADQQNILQSLLKTGAGTVSDICFQLAFESPNSFSLLFKKTFGINPSQVKDKA